MILTRKRHLPSTIKVKLLFLPVGLKQFFPPFAVLFVFLLAACEGPVGPAGPAGVQGPAGPQGEQGVPGNSNMRTATFRLVASDFEEDTSLEVAGYSSSLVTQGVMDRGAILAYSDLGTNGQGWIALPLQLGTVTLTYAFGPGLLQVFIFRPVGTAAVAGSFDGHQIRFLIFEPATAALLENVDTNDYEAVLSAIGELP